MRRRRPLRRPAHRPRDSARKACGKAAERLRPAGATGDPKRLVQAVVNEFGKSDAASKGLIDASAEPVPATLNDAINLFFREKAFWVFGRGQRLGDLRRLIRQYHRTQDNVFPTGTFHKNGNPAYGTDVNFPVTTNEIPNPAWKGCIDRDA